MIPLTTIFAVGSRTIQTISILPLACPNRRPTRMRPLKLPEGRLSMPSSIALEPRRLKCSPLRWPNPLRKRRPPTRLTRKQLSLQLAADADRAKANLDSYEMAKALANVDATHRARREATAAGILVPPAATAPILVDNMQALRDPGTGQAGVATSSPQCRTVSTFTNRFSQAVGCFALLPSQN